MAKGKAAVEIMRRDGLVANGKTKILGDLDMDRVQVLIGKLRTVFLTQKVPVPNLNPGDIATNDYLDPNVTLTGP